MLKIVLYRNPQPPPIWLNSQGVLVTNFLNVSLTEVSDFFFTLKMEKSCENGEACRTPVKNSFEAEHNLLSQNRILS